MKLLCKHCGQPLPPEQRAGVYLPPMKAQIFDMVKKSPGISAATMAKRMYGRNELYELRRIRVHVSQINELLAGVEIKILGDGDIKKNHRGDGFRRGEYRVIKQP